MASPSKPAASSAPWKPSVRTTEMGPPEPVKYRSMKEIMKVAKRVDLPPVRNDYYENLLCEVCRSGEREEEMLLCDRCDRGYHLYCLRPILARVPTGSWFCSGCSGDNPLPDPGCSMTQKKIIDFFQIHKCIEAPPGKKYGTPQEGRKRKKRSLVMQKKRRRFLQYIPSEDPTRRLEQMHSLAYALTVSKLEFSNELTYGCGMAPRSSNQATLEVGGMQVLSREDKETLELCRAMYKRGEYPPLLVVYDSVEGFTVQADGPIKDMTIIAEYAGDVDYMKNREHDDCDSLMTLILAEDPSNSLVICPDKRGNISRFFSGINNHIRECRKKRNIKCVRYNVDGECTVLLVACRDISSGERLYYDYNGYEQRYPTHNFV